MIHHLDIVDGYDDESKLRLSGRTDGCSCCSRDFNGAPLEEAKKLADEWIQELSLRLEEAKNLKAKLEGVDDTQWETA